MTNNKRVSIKSLAFSFHVFQNTFLETLMKVISSCICIYLDEQMTTDRQTEDEPIDYR